ncbi:MAG: hypothetical protein AB7P03_17105 [Kofleriaceae bacterium]
MTTATDRPPDRPSVPRPRRSLFAIVMLVFCVVLVGGYSAMAYTQHELPEIEREEIPASVRSSPGGYRSYHFWHGGYHGGK